MSAPTLHRLFDLPLGSRFRYVEHPEPENTYVFLGHDGSGLVGDAPTDASRRPFQGLYSAAESRAEFEAMVVEVVPVVEAAPIAAHIAEWRKGCTCGGPRYDRMHKNPEGTTSPARCEECTVGLIEAISKEVTP